MEHQYPGPISGDEHMLAELMLPDQAHVRSQDWTIFFLHKDTTAEDEAREQRKERRRRRRKKKEALENGEPPGEDDIEDIEDELLDEDGDDALESTDDEEEAEGPPLIYVLNLVNTKQDQSVKRSAYSPSKNKHLLTQIQRCCSESHGNMYSAFIFTHLQAITAPGTRRVLPEPDTRNSRIFV